MKTWEIKLLNKNIIKNKKNLVLSIAGKTKILFSFLIFFFFTHTHPKYSNRILIIKNDIIMTREDFF